MRLVSVFFLLFALAPQSATFALDLNGISYPTFQQAELLKRQSDNSSDVCNQAFPGRYSEICQPNSISNTLCCIIPDEDRPKCVSIFGYGFCCTEHQSCFVDLSSTCGRPNSVECNSDACCPEFTSCATNFNQTRELVRCDIRPELIPEVVFGTSRAVSGSARSTIATTSTSSTAIQTSTDPSVTTSDTSTATSQPNSGSSATAPLSGGAIAGIVIGAIVALLIGVGIGWFIFNQRAHRYEEPGLPPLPPGARFNAQDGNQQFSGAPYTAYNDWDGYQLQQQQYKPPGTEVQELHSRSRALELQAQAT
ncbi:hypothetical protein TWF730_009574 [Orbilia blumenaviensis]|uniref:Mid2 domain-containing protein n=1 Tax=Orbilia blumenaviensis TaxID=1796055 RepID=A0AAV9UT10_9PEZI